MRVTAADKIRFAAKVEPSAEIRPGMSTPCLEWKAARGSTGYGQCRISGKLYRAHRVAWEMANGPVPDGLDVLHKCDNPPCVNVEHLFLGTHTDNMHDMFAKGRKVVARGERHGSHLHPECLARGDRHGSHLHPESVPRGERNRNAKLNEEKVRRIFQLRGEGWTQARLGAEFGVSDVSIADVLSRKKWAHVDLGPSGGAV